MHDLPKCPDCNVLLYLRGKTKTGFGKYQCVKCEKWYSEYEPIRQALQRQRQQKQLEMRAKRAKTLAEFLKTFCPTNDTSKVENYVRRSVAAKKLGVSRQRIHQKIQNKQLNTMEVAGILWVEII